MKVIAFLVLTLALAAGCGSKEAASGSAATSAGAGAAKPPGTAAPGSTGGSGWGQSAPASSGNPSAGGDSFFAGDAPSAVKMKATKTFAMDPGMLMIQGVEGWSGGQLPGYDYMSMSKDTTATARVAAATGVTGDLGCKELGTPAAMAPLKAKNLKETTAAVLRRVGKNKFVAREGVCSGDGPKGPVDIHYLDILRKDKDGLWHYAVLVGLPKDASQDLKNEAMAWARSIEYNGGNGFSMP